MATKFLTKGSSKVLMNSMHFVDVLNKSFALLNIQMCFFHSRTLKKERKEKLANEFD